MKKILLTIWLVSMAGTVIAVFWQNEWKYNLPTPVPANYHPPKQAEHINLSKNIYSDSSKPLFLHFFNPDCPCSKFNIKQFCSLAKQYEQRVNFAIVVMGKDDYSQQQIQEKFHLQIPIYFDTSIANTCGVISTPQADIQTDYDHPHDFYSDNYRLSIVMNNLISNAIRYQNIETPNPFVKVGIKTTRHEATISIEDNGIGINEENHQKIFDMFYRVSENSKGSGLGLYIVKEAVDALNGSINLESEPGSGTTFKLTIPNQKISYKKV